MANSFLEGLVNWTSSCISAFDKIKAKNTAPKSSDEIIILTADKLRELKWMTAQQILPIYGAGKYKVKIDDDSEAYRELKWLDQDQLEAIFGKFGN